MFCDSKRMVYLINFKEEKNYQGYTVKNKFRKKLKFSVKPEQQK